MFAAKTEVSQSWSRYPNFDLSSGLRARGTRRMLSAPISQFRSVLRTLLNALDFDFFGISSGLLLQTRGGRHGLSSPPVSYQPVMCHTHLYHFNMARRVRSVSFTSGRITPATSRCQPIHKRSFLPCDIPNGKRIAMRLIRARTNYHTRRLNVRNFVNINY